MFSLDGLNTEQRKAAEAVNGPVLILAGAGSGKTRTITYRIANMLINHHINPFEVLAVSFTNKAADEMNERVKKLVPAKLRRGLSLSTFHSLGIRILKEDIHYLGYTKKFSIYDSADQQSIVREALRSLKAKKKFDKKIIMSKIGFLKNKGITASEYKNSPYFFDEPYDHATEYVYHYYEDKLHFYNALDFDDILLKVVELFRKHPEVAQKYSKKFKYLMIDEYQDTNGLQFELVKGLTSTHHNICVVGDDDQSIYAFRGATIENILNFEKEYANTQVIKLERNYRSTTHILSLANIVIKENKKRKDKTMISDNDDGPKPILWMAGDSEHEAQVIIEDIIKHQASGKPLGDIAILYRSNTQVPPIEAELRYSQVPYTIIGGQKFFEKKEIKDLIAFLSVINNPKDELSLRRILNVPYRGIGTTTLKKLLAISEEKKIPLFETFNFLENTDIKDKTKASILSFKDLILRYQILFQAELKAPLEKLVNEIGYFDFIDKSYDETKIAPLKKEDVHNFILSTGQFEERFKTEAKLDFYIDRLKITDNQDNQSVTEDGKKNEVTLMTLHSSKGLEFDTVYLLGLEEELLPHKKTIVQGEDISEERRLCYVGLTRAKRKLIMTYCKERTIYNKKVKRNKSRFLNSLKEGYYIEQDRTNFGHMTEEEANQYKEDFFSDLLSSLDD